MISGATAVNTRVHLELTTSHTRLRVHWAPGIPHALFRGARLVNASGALRGERFAHVQVYAYPEAVIASAAKQSTLSLLFVARWIASLRSQ